jgi:hypothetical protein
MNCDSLPRIGRGIVLFVGWMHRSYLCWRF